MLETFFLLYSKYRKYSLKKTTIVIIVTTVGGCVVVSMGLLVLSLSVPEFYLTKDKSSAVDDQVETKTIEKVCIEENPRNYVQ
jgi:hypothetical protein